MGTATLAKLSANEKVSMDVIERICVALDCQPGDIMEFVFEDK
nr:helix-turn-helix transcriptional regulator [Enterococcus ureilyticus]